MPSLVEPEFLARLEYLYVVAKNLFVGSAASDRTSKKFGVGSEFADFRPYVPGDDYRHIDWASYARRDTLTLKLFSEQQELPIYLLIDASLSMLTGAPEKLFFAKKIAAALGYIGLSNEDPVTIVPFDEGARTASRQFRGKGQLQSMLSFIDGIQARGVTSLTSSIAEFVQRHPRKGMVVLLSDCFDRAGFSEAIRLLHYHRYDLLVVQLNEREEVDPSMSGDMELVDSETGELMTVKLTPQLVSEYKQRFEHQRGELKSLCATLGRGYLSAVTDHPFEQLIFDVFRRGGLLR